MSTESTALEIMLSQARPEISRTLALHQEMLRSLAAAHGETQAVADLTAYYGRQPRTITAALLALAIRELAAKASKKAAA